MSILNFFQNLPFDIQEHIWKTYYSNNVLNEMFEKFNRDQEEEMYEEQFREAYGDINDEFKRMMEIEDESDEEV